MRQTVKRDRHSEIAEQRARKSATYGKTFACGVALKLHAEKKPNFDREVALV